jgi:hypothetical protein
MAQRYEVSSQASQSTVSVLTSSTVVLAANPSRKGVILSNAGANNIYVNLGGGTAVNTNVLLPPNSAALVLTHLCPTNAINAIAATGATNLSVTELT